MLAWYIATSRDEVAPAWFALWIYTRFTIRHQVYTASFKALFSFCQVALIFIVPFYFVNSLEVVREFSTLQGFSTVKPYEECFSILILYFGNIANHFSAVIARAIVTIKYTFERITCIQWE
jgi:hypothetical protein